MRVPDWKRAHGPRHRTLVCTGVWTGQLRPVGLACRPNLAVPARNTSELEDVHAVEL